MASFDPIIRMNENMFRGPEKKQSKAVRKPLGDVTNSSKPVEKFKSSAKTFNGLKGLEKVKTKVARKPLGDVTNSQRPRAQEKSSKKDRVETVSAVNVQKANNWIKEEGFLHNHDECIKAQSQCTSMSLDYFLETVGLKKDPSATSLHTTQFPNLSIVSDDELETPMELTEYEIDMTDLCAPPSPPSPKAPGSPCWGIDWNNLNFSPLKLKESPVRN
ncbi:hypothetical protein RND81_05G091100 [Saponaria officinalis]|uniref:Uncharacterized protein n=1 Tax=Saponaria officinalis TaxID=3572 RepID=A0AAW1KZ16_SAPOF